MAQSVMPVPASSGPSKRNLVLLFVTLMITMLLASLSQMVLSSALPTIVGELHGVEHMMWVITAYLLSSTIMMPIYGKISDLFGRKPILTAAILVFVAGSVLGGLAPNMELLIAARFVQGLGGGGLIILSQAALADVVPARDRGKYMGIMGGVFAFSSVAGPMIGGWLTEGPGWRWTFWLNIPLGIIAVVAVIVLMKLPRPENQTRPKVDFFGMAILAVATAGLVLIGTWGGSLYDWLSVEIITLAIITVVAAVAFVFVESRVSEPIIPLALFRNKNFNLTTAAGMFIAVAMFGTVGYMPTYFQMAVGANARDAGFLMIPMMASMLVTSIITGAAVSRTGRYKIFPLAGVAILAIGITLLATVKIGTPVWQTCGYMMIMGIGLGLSMQVLVLVVQNAFPQRVVGTATAGNNFFRQVGGSLGSAVVGSLFVGRLSSLLAERLPAGQGPADGAASLTPDSIATLPAEARAIVVEAYNEALIPIFLYIMPLVLISFVLLLFVDAIPLATKIDRDEAVSDSLGQGQLPATTGSVQTLGKREKYGEGFDDREDAAGDLR